jgi:HPt (histidine-containing phosphotransfer) domain-containing protein
MVTPASMDPPADEPAFVPATLESMFGDTPGVIAAVLETFCTNMGLHLQQLQAAVRADDARAQQQIAHRIKGAARMSGAMRLAQAAEALEQTARDTPAEAGGQMHREAASVAIVEQWAHLPGDAGFCRARWGGQANHSPGPG